MIVFITFFFDYVDICLAEIDNHDKCIVTRKLNAYSLLGSCLLWVMSTEISVDIAVDIAVEIAVDSRSIVGRQSVDTRSIVGR